MLKENLKELRKAKGISQEELAIKLNVVRQTVSKWEQGLSVPDAEMLISISEVFETPVAKLLGENITVAKENELNAISEKLEIINLQLSNERKKKRKILRGILIGICVFIVIIYIALFLLNSPYLSFDYTDIEYAILGTIYHSFEWAYVRVAPFILVILIGIIFATNKKE